jgi:pyruvate/2-oxoacid:ferredoxin oxidoreductase alpha subunit
LYGSGQATTLCITRGNTHQHVLQALELLGLSQQVDVLNVVAVFPIPKSLMAQQLQNRTRILYRLMAKLPRDKLPKFWPILWVYHTNPLPLVL